MPLHIRRSWDRGSGVARGGRRTSRRGRRRSSSRSEGVQAKTQEAPRTAQSSKRPWGIQP
eukprot:13516125-Alexandrium_andersonii.AAC.1